MAIKDTLRNDILAGIEERLADEKTQKKFLDTFFTSALTNPKSFAHQRMVEIILPVSAIEQIDVKRAQAQKKDITLHQFAIFQNLYDKQQGILNCIGKDKEIMAITSRRTGKTTADCALLVYVCLTPNTHALYINITYKQAEKQLFNPEEGIEYWAEIAGLKIIKEDKTDGFIYFENGSFIQYGSNQNKASADKYRGFNYKVIIIDEIGHQSNLDYLLNEVLYPAQADYGDRYSILYTGTPSRIPHHFSTEMFLNEDNGIKKFNWSMLENPFLPNPREFIESICKKKGLDINSPFIQREYFGKFVADTEALVIPKRTYKADKKSFPYDGIIIGVDYGYTDNNAIVAVGYNIEKKKAETVTELKFNRATVTEVMNRIENVYQNCLNLVEDKNTVMIYADTNEQSITADLRIKRKLPAFNCYKYNKQYALELLRDMCGTGALLIDKDEMLDREFDQTLYKRDSDDNIIPEIDDEVFHPDGIFALLYAMRRVFHELSYDIEWKESSEEASWKYKKVSDENGVRLEKTETIEDYGIYLTED
ncbi:MAG: terminase family protein [Treponema sp.]|nr:terminase family protein [Candidatus Treponema merdequi]